MSELPENARELDVRTIPHAQRHATIFSVLDQLAVGECLVIKNDHDPVPLRFQVEGLYGSEIGWEYVEQGPEVFRLAFTRLEAPQESSGATTKSDGGFRSTLPLAPSDIKRPER